MRTVDDAGLFLAVASVRRFRRQVEELARAAFGAAAAETGLFALLKALRLRQWRRETQGLWLI